MTGVFRKRRQTGKVTTVRWGIREGHLQANDHQRLLKNQLKLGRGKEGSFPYRFQRQHGPAQMI